ncbi:hypothetical protein [Ornithinimicrobium panacihumi]|uniref:hypothetical protein n=1 Tax=Ornithinimicrobium panacihumi TaxID=2008449 RepID=UPI003F8ACAB0
MHAQRGDRILKITSPVLYLDRVGRPAVFLREPDEANQVSVREELAACLSWLIDRCRPGAPGVVGLELNTPGDGIISNNRTLVHGRTPFVDVGSQRRRLARKCWTSAPGFSSLSQAPGLWVDEQYSTEVPDVFDPALLDGMWDFDPASQQNRLVTV